MPPKTRNSKSSKVSKENIGVSFKTKTKATNKTIKLPRKALGDKTNSASDDNVSFLQSKPSVNVIGNDANLLIKQRPRRERRVPNRYVEKNGIEDLSRSKNTSIQSDNKSKPTPIKNIPLVQLSPLKTPKIILDTSLTVTRPKRICRLPSKFDDHSISPSKYVPVQPAYASTPKVRSNPAKQIEKKNSNKNVKPTKPFTSIKATATNKKTENKRINSTSNSNSSNSSADTNNNPKTDQLPLTKTKKKQNTSPKPLVSNTKSIASKKVLNKDFSIRILQDKKKSLKRDASNFDVYEFTYDPNEEPPPQKKKRKKPTKKRVPKLKTVGFKDTYDKNLAKALTTLKNTIAGNSAKTIVTTENVKAQTTQTFTAHPVTDTVVTTTNTHPVSSNSDQTHISVKNYNSIRVEDIALDFEQDCHVDDVNYSPVHSFSQPPSLATQKNSIRSPERLAFKHHQNNAHNSEKSASNNDPLNIRNDLSFFDDQPVASSSMNISTRNPNASPWRVEFGSLPIKWHANTYVKPNMTPALECSFMNFSDSKKKHVYTNMVPETNEENDLPHIYDDYASKLKQTSIMSFIKEVCEKNAKKKREKMTPIKANSLFEDLNSTPTLKGTSSGLNQNTTPKKNAQGNVESNNPDFLNQHRNINNKSVDSSDICNKNDKENSKEIVKSSDGKKRDKNVTYFGFDDSENQDLENVSPVKKMDKRRLRALKPRSRAVLQEINEQKGPTRAVLPVAVKSKAIQNPATADKLFDQMKSATEPPVFLDKHLIQSIESTNTTEVPSNVDANDDQSVHLFEDLEVVHHLKAHRKSYGKAKKAVTFRHNSVSDSDVPHGDVVDQSASSDEDDLHDLTFKIPEIERKRTTRKTKPKKPKISKKEEQEVEAWAAGFNSMCEDIEEFDLVVE